MDNLVLVNKHAAKNNSLIKSAQKKASKYYKETLFSSKKGAPKARIRKIVDIENIDFLSYEAVPDIAMEDNRIVSVDREYLVELCKKCKLAGRSGNDFLVAKKLEEISKGATLLINAVECDPGLVHDAWIYRNRLEAVEYGAKLLNQIYGFNRIVLATKEPLKEDFSFEQIRVNDRFPFGYEKILIKRVLGIDLAQNEYPSQRNILVMNLQTILTIGEMVNNEEAAQYKYITVSDLSGAKAFVTRVKIGEPVSNIIDRFFPNKGKLESYCGGGVFGAHAVEADELINDTTSLVTISTKVDYSNAKKCVGCGACVRNCPMKVNVKALVAVSENKRSTEKNLEKCNINQCIGCGACTYVCSARKDVRQIVSCLKQSSKQ